MTIRINHEGLSVAVSESLVNYLSALLIGDSAPNEATDSFTFNFKDPNYSVVNGGFHPVEIRIEPNLDDGDDKWKLCYITDFRLVGDGVCEELAVDADFSFELNLFNSMYGSYPLIEADDFYSTWESNFLSYAKELDVFNLEITRGD